MIELKLDLSAVKRMGDRLEGVYAKDMPFLCAYALTKTMQGVQLAEREVMGSVFDRPTPYTQRSLAVIPATKERLATQLHVREGGGTPAWKFLDPEIEGGARRKKSFELRLERAGILKPGEYVVPGAGIALDAYGNIRGGTIERILSQLGAAEQWAGYQANMTTRSRKRALRKAGGRYFVLRGTKAPDGVYFRSGGKIVPVLIFVPRPHYRPRYPYYSTAEKIFGRAFAANFHDGWRRYVAPKLKLR